MAPDARLTLSLARCGLRLLYWSPATKHYDMVAVYAAPLPVVKGGGKNSRVG